MSREDVIRQIVERDVQGHGLAEELILREDGHLHAAACEHFGTWNTALRYAGIDGRRVRRRKVTQKGRSRRVLIHSRSGAGDVVREIRRLCLMGYDLSASRNIQRDRPLYEAARRNFGSWRQALVAVGINLERARLPKRPRKFNKDYLLDVLRRRSQAEQTLIWHMVCLENRELATAVKTAFGSWKRAMTAAGLSDKYRNHSSSQKWDKQRILDAIRRRQQEGKSLQCSRVREEQAGLVSAARRYFPTWADAVTAAGGVPRVSNE
jgi:hypothetical protein